MTITNGYCGTTELAEWMGVDDSADTENMEWAISAMCRMIDVYCDRRFYADDTATARVYYPDSRYEVAVDDFHTTTGLVVATGTDGTYPTTLTSDQYQLEPLNQLGAGGITVPYQRIRAISTTFPLSVGRPTVQVTARWGWAAVPDAVYQATLISAARMFRRRQTPEGYAAGEAFGVVRVANKMDPDARILLDPYRRHSGQGLVVG